MQRRLRRRLSGLQSFLNGRAPGHRLLDVSGDQVPQLRVGEHVVASLMTYELAGRQYLIVPVGDTMYAFSLPEKTTAKK